MTARRPDNPRCGKIRSPGGVTMGGMPCFTCPACNATSYNEHDIAAGYCGRCHWYTGNPELAHQRPELFTAHGVEPPKPAGRGVTIGDMTATDLIVATRDPELLDRTVQQLPMSAAVVVEGSYDPDAGTCRVRVFSDPGFIRFAITQQGYGTVLGEESVGEPQS